MWLRNILFKRIFYILSFWLTPINGLRCANIFVAPSTTRRAKLDADGKINVVCIAG